MLEALGIYGMAKIETPILAGLVTGEPVLLVGGHGTAKTSLCQKLADALEQRYWAYDASKALFEDILGFPNPQSLDKGEIDYIPTTISIWGKQFVLIDELSRANPSMQNKWLEVIRSRQIMGKKLPDLKYVFAAMNPPSYLGAHPLDEALAGRFAIVVKVPDVQDLNDTDVVRVVKNLCADDDPLRLQMAERTASSLVPLLEGARTLYQAFPIESGNRLAAYVSMLSRYLESKELRLDGRRLGMMWRSLKAIACLDSIRNNKPLLSVEDMGPILALAIPHLVPFEAVGREVNAAVLRAAHESAFGALSGKATKTLMLPRNALAAAQRFVAENANIHPLERREAISRFIVQSQQKGDPKAKATGAIGLGVVAEAVGRGDVFLEPDEAYRILSRFRKLTEIDVVQTSEMRECVWDFTENKGEAVSSIRSWICMRLAFSLSYENSRIDNQEVQALFTQLGNLIEEESILRATV